MKKIVELTSRYWYVFIIFTLVASIGSGYMLTKLKMNNDLVDFFPKSDPDVQTFTRTGEKFGSSYVNMITIKTDNIFTHKNLTIIKNFTKELEKIDGVDQVISITNILDVKKISGGLEVGKLINKGLIPTKKEELDKLKKYTLSKEMYRNSIISKDGKIVAIIEKIKPTADKEAISKKTKELAEKISSKESGIKPFFGGMPFAMYYANQIVEGDLSLLTPMVAFLIIFVLFISFRSVKGVVLPLITVVIATLITMGLMPVFHTPLTMLSSMIPVVLLSTGTAYVIHLINADKEVTIKNPNILFKDRLNEIFNKVGTPIILSGLTTVIGFVSLVTADLTPLKEFGIFIATGIFITLILTFFFVTSLLRIWPKSISTRQNNSPSHPSNFASQGGESKDINTINNESKHDKTIMDKFFSSISEFIFAKPLVIVIITLIITIVSIIVIPSMKEEVNYFKYFAKGHPVRVGVDLLEKEFGGALPIVLDFKTSNIKHPAFLRVLEKTEKKLKTVNHVKNPQSVVGLISEMNEIMNGHRLTPNTIKGVENLWLFIDGKKELTSMVGNNKKEALIQVSLNKSDTPTIVSASKDVKKIVNAIPLRWALLKKTNLKNDKVKNEKLLDIQIKSILSEIEDDLFIAKLNIKNKPEFIKELKQNLIASKPPLNIWKDVISKSLNDYISSENSEVEITDDNVKRELINSISSLKKWDNTKVKEILSAKIDKSEIEDDPELVDVFAKSLNFVWKDAEKNARVISMMNILNKYLSSPVNKSNSMLLQRLKGDFWQFTESEVWISESDYKKITGNTPSKIFEFSVIETGITKILANIQTRLLTSQMQSLGMAIFLVLILLMIQLKSFFGGLLAIVPVVFTIIFNFGLMSITQVPLDNATMMIASIAIGIGIDYTIHIISRFKKEFLRTQDIHEALSITIRTAGKAVLINTFSVMLGFLVLIFSELEPLRRFGYLTAVTMIISAGSAITIFPAIVLVTKASFMTKLNKSKKKEEMNNKIVYTIKKEN